MIHWGLVGLKLGRGSRFALALASANTGGRLHCWRSMDNQPVARNMIFSEKERVRVDPTHRVISQRSACYSGLCERKGRDAAKAGCPSPIQWSRTECSHGTSNATIPVIISKILILALSHQLPPHFPPVSHIPSFPRSSPSTMSWLAGHGLLDHEEYDNLGVDWVLQYEFGDVGE